MKKEEHSKPIKCETCGGMKFWWNCEGGWICTDCDPPLIGISNFIKREMRIGRNTITADMRINLSGKIPEVKGS
jgi:hypothetical protein